MLARLDGRGLHRDLVLAAALRLIDLGFLDSRTWNATVLAAAGLAVSEHAGPDSAGKRAKP